MLFIGLKAALIWQKNLGKMSNFQILISNFFTCNYFAHLFIIEQNKNLLLYFSFLPVLKRFEMLQIMIYSSAFSTFSGICVKFDVFFCFFFVFADHGTLWKFSMERKPSWSTNCEDKISRSKSAKTKTSKGSIEWNNTSRGKQNLPFII